MNATFSKRVVLGVVGMAAITGVAYALVTFDPTCQQTPSNSTGSCGFVGKGDVSVPFGWNDATLQVNASNVTFTLESKDTYTATCEWFTGPTSNRDSHEVTHTKKTGVFATVAKDLRKNNQEKITGFLLTGMGAESESGTIPVLGGQCPGGGTDGTWISVAKTGTGIKALFANYPGLDSVKIWQ
jgi:hypothetical protein